MFTSADSGRPMNAQARSYTSHARRRTLSASSAPASPPNVDPVRVAMYGAESRCGQPLNHRRRHDVARPPGDGRGQPAAYAAGVDRERRPVARACGVEQFTLGRQDELHPRVRSRRGHREAEAREAPVDTAPGRGDSRTSSLRGVNRYDTRERCGGGHRRTSCRAAAPCAWVPSTPARSQAQVTRPSRAVCSSRHGVITTQARWPQVDPPTSAGVTVGHGGMTRRA